MSRIPVRSSTPGISDSDIAVSALNTHGQTGTCLEHGSQLSSGKGLAGKSAGQSGQAAERLISGVLDRTGLSFFSSPAIKTQRKAAPSRCGENASDLTKRRGALRRILSSPTSRRGQQTQWDT